jgi:hypothetical protein
MFKDKGTLSKFIRDLDKSDPISASFVLADIHAAIKLLLSLLRVLIGFSLNRQHEIDLLPVIKHLLQLLPCDFIHGHGEFGIFDRVLDLSAWIIDELPRTQYRNLLSWCRENMNLFETSKLVESRIEKILPFQSTNRYLSGLSCLGKEDTIRPVFDIHFKPWIWIEKASQQPLINVWNEAGHISQVNDTPIPLSAFDARVIYPRPSLFQSLCELGAGLQAPERNLGRDIFRFSGFESSKRKNESNGDDNDYVPGKIQKMG